MMPAEPAMKRAQDRALTEAGYMSVADYVRRWRPTISPKEKTMSDQEKPKPKDQPQTADAPIPPKKPPNQEV